MNQFIENQGKRLLGTLSGFDRLRFRGTLLWLTSEAGMADFLYRNDVLLKDFRSFVNQVTNRVRKAGELLAAQTPDGAVQYLRSTRISKEGFVRDIAERHPGREGLLAVLSCVEPCRTFDLRKDPVLKKLRLHYGERQCLHHYFYLRHPELGLLHVRLQTWFPFTIHICLNGREWLARRLDRAGIDYDRRDNCFAAIDDVPGAQRFMDQQLRQNWPTLLKGLQQTVHPTHPQITGRCSIDYYWSVDESEWATDLMFRSPADLAQLYPRLIRHGMLTLGSGDVLRFLGRKLPGTSEVNSDVRTRSEGVRIKHRVKRNSIKMYDKEHSVLRIETTIIDPKDFKVFRPKQDDPDGNCAWRAMRKGVADLHRRAQVSQAANDRYAEALSSVDESTTVAEAGVSVCERIVRQGRSWRALNPLGQADAALLAAISRGEFAINGFRNRDLQALLLPSATTAAQQRKQSNQITRKLQLLRAHGLIQKIPKTHRYKLTKQGQTHITTLLTARHATTKQLTQSA